MTALDKFKNKFIVFEGADSSGKSSVAKLLTEKINDSFNKDEIDFTAQFTFQPGDQTYGTIAPLIRSLCKDKRWELSKCGNLFAFLLDRAECIDKIVRPRLKQGQTIILDRYTYSTIAYQLFGKQIYDDIATLCGEEQASILLSWFRNPYPDVSPHIVYYFPEKVGNRKDDDYDLFDRASKEFSIRVQNAYEQMYLEHNQIKGPKWIKIKPGSSAEETLERVIYAAF